MTLLKTFARVVGLGKSLDELFKGNKEQSKTEYEKDAHVENGSSETQNKAISFEQGGCDFCRLGPNLGRNSPKSGQIRALRTEFG